MLLFALSLPASAQGVSTTEILIGQTGGFTGTSTHVCQIVAADLAALGDLNFDDEGAMQQETLLDADTAGYPADGNSAGMRILVVGPDYQTLEDLDAFLVAFTDLLVHFDSVAAADIDNGRLLVLL